MTAVAGAARAPDNKTLSLATVHGLFHIAIKTDNLAATRRFWVCAGEGEEKPDKYVAGASFFDKATYPKLG
jgi:hypothetical protein